MKRVKTNNRWNYAFHYKEHLFQYKPLVLISLTFWISIVCLVSLMVLSFPRNKTGFTNRNLLQSVQNVYYYSNCTNTTTIPNILQVFWENCDFEKSTNLTGVWISLYILITLIIFIALAVICDDFFVPSLEVMSEKLKLSPDVAGATFMAAGSSSPELFSSIAAVTFESDVGIGTITGSAVFNLLVIISLSAAVSKSVLKLDWRPITRDCAFYLISIGWLIFSVHDTIINWYDAVVMLLIYASYITFMVFNAKIMKRCNRNWDKCCYQSKVEPLNEEDDDIFLNSLIKYDRRNTLINVISLPAEKRMSLPAFSRSVSIIESIEEDVSDDIKPVIQCCNLCNMCPPIRGSPPKYSDYMVELPTTESHRFSRSNIWFLYILKWIIFVVAFPFLVMFSYTIVDCTKQQYKKYFLMSFFVSILWLGSLTFAMVIIVTKIGCLINVNSFVMSLVVLAAGSSLPDLLGSLIVAREGCGDMAVSNAIGSNVFDINTGLGIPFMIKILINRGSPISLFSQKERKAYCQNAMLLIPHVKFTCILLFLLIMSYTIFTLAKFKLNKVIGFSFFGLYIVFLIYAFLQQFLCSENQNYIC